MNEVKITPKSANTFKIILGTLELNVYCCDDHISIKSNSKINYPEQLLGDVYAKDSVRFNVPLKNTKSKNGDL